MNQLRWESDRRRTKLRDLLLLVFLTALPLAVAANTMRSKHDPVIKSIVVGTALLVPGCIGLAWFVCCVLLRLRERTWGDLFLVLYMTLTFLSVLAVVMVFMFDKPMSALLGIALFGFLAYLSSWI